MIDDNGLDICVVGGVVEVDDVDGFLGVLEGYRGPGSIQVVDAGVVAGERHLIHAAEKAFDSWRREPISQSLDMEILLYVVGERQINRALDIAGVDEGRQEIGLVIAGDVDVDAVVDEIGLDVEGSVLSYSNEKEERILKAFDISVNEIEAVGRDKIPMLVLERVSLLDVDR
ncbi:KEOPS complex subunit Cgi121 [Methanonatronarchaeum sp. AMET6-2]|uniref:KEOPS complex subunit Cgi121 n=1 Tax=Methanonatronarchaeum sp. AMET6-2 TaxID=2933293 RepID=UPI001225C4FC|nr:KEOPS complex subunit Cgi121 [Methanonatronarchaeum sp. AMET6-2]RZN63374.1 MAG: hypothetical protein EF811_00560 [Methanonatronarchaeia archaeon]UOY10564.1 KEOPS complex subunit Cgi121 [Methanonatronarchaeum sp. AMET6-2]